MTRWSRCRSTSGTRVARLGLLAALALMIPFAVAEAAVDIKVVIDYEAAAGELPEGLAVSKSGDVFLGLGPLGEVRKIDRDGTMSTLATIPLPLDTFPGVVGLAVDAPGNVYAAVSAGDPATTGVYKIAPDGSFARLPGTEEIAFPNGITFDKQGNLYVTDTTAGSRLGCPRGEKDRIWLSQAARRRQERNFGIPIGAHGIAFRQNAVVVANSEGARLVHIRSARWGAGAATVLAEGDALYGADGITFGVHGNVWVASSSRARSSAYRRAASDSRDGRGQARLCVERGVRQSSELWAVNFAIGAGRRTCAAAVRRWGEGQPLP